MMLRKRRRTSMGMALAIGFLLSFEATLHPKGARMENVRDETRRKKNSENG
jgi:hypothetical protein